MKIIQHPFVTLTKKCQRQFYDINQRPALYCIQRCISAVLLYFAVFCCICILLYIQYVIQYSKFLMKIQRCIAVFIQQMLYNTAVLYSTEYVQQIFWGKKYSTEYSKFHFAGLYFLQHLLMIFYKILHQIYPFYIYFFIIHILCKFCNL